MRGSEFRGGEEVLGMAQQFACWLSTSVAGGSRRGPGVLGPGRASSTPWGFRNMGSRGMALAGEPGGRSRVSCFGDEGSGKGRRGGR